MKTFNNGDILVCLDTSDYGGAGWANNLIFKAKKSLESEIAWGGISMQGIFIECLRLATKEEIKILGNKQQMILPKTTNTIVENYSLY